MRKNKKFLLTFLFLFAAAGFSYAFQAEAQLQYELLEKVPGTENVGSDLKGYLEAIYKVALIIVTLSAVLMVSIGGFMYLTSAGNTSAMGSAKSVIFDSIIGLVIALVAWLILYVINPDLTSITLNGLSVTSVPGAPSVPAAPAVPPSGTAASKAQQIIDSGVLASSGDCSSPSGTVSPMSNMRSVASGASMAACSNGCGSSGSGGCTDNAANPSETMLDAIISVRNSGKSFTVTSIGGGSHSNASAHYRGNAIDITPVTQELLDAFVANGARAPSGNSASMCERAGINVGCNGGGANHIHLVFP